VSVPHQLVFKEKVIIKDDKFSSETKYTCGSEPTSVSGYVIGKDDGSHTGLSRPTLAH